jgi:spore coat protein CotH
MHKHYLIQKKDVSLVKIREVVEGPEEELINLLDFCNEYAKKDVSNDKIYEEINNYIDEDSLIELYASEIYIGNNDWPGNNDGEWRNIGEKIEGNKYSDGKWRFITFDLETTMGNYYGDIGGIEVYEYNTFNHTVKKSTGPPTSLFVALSKNEDFRNKYVKYIVIM